MEKERNQQQQQHHHLWHCPNRRPSCAVERDSNFQDDPLGDGVGLRNLPNHKKKQKHLSALRLDWRRIVPANRLLDVLFFFSHSILKYLNNDKKTSIYRTIVCKFYFIFKYNDNLRKNCISYFIDILSRIFFAAASMANEMN